MDREVVVEEKAERAEATKSPYRSGHLMCRTSLWGVMGFAACAYFAWLSFQHVVRSEFDWPHDSWTATTYSVWIVLLVGLMLDTRCFRERLFFGLLVANFVSGFLLTLWRTIPTSDVRNARIGTGILWSIAALASLSTMGRAARLESVQPNPSARG